MTRIIPVSILKWLGCLFIIISIASCQKEFLRPAGDLPPADSTISDPGLDLTTKVMASVISGFVTNENDAAVKGAAVTIGGIVTVTDTYGYFEVRNVAVIKNSALITVNQTGYYPTVKNYIAEERKGAFFRIKLIRKTDVGSFSASNGGTISAAGIKIVFTANSLVNASSGVAYTGTVSAFSDWIDPASAGVYQLAPGDGRGISLARKAMKLYTYGMAAIELRSTAGDLLQLASGKSANVVLSISQLLTSSAPASISSWYLDNSTGLWKETGIAVRSGNDYTATISKISYLNYAGANEYVGFSATLKDLSGRPLSYARVKISDGSNLQNTVWAYTDSSGAVPASVSGNSNLTLEVFPGGECSASFYSQPLNTTDALLSLGTVPIYIASGIYSSISGSVTDCTNAAVSDGFIIVSVYNTNYRYPLTGGNYDFTHVLCIGSETATFIGVKVTGSQQASAVVTYTIHSGTNTVPPIKVC